MSSRGTGTGRKSIPDRSFLVTFDDGLADHAETVCPILDAMGMKGVFFVSTRPLVTGELEPTHQTQRLLAKLGGVGLDHAVRRWASAQDAATYEPPGFEVIALDCEITSYAPDDDGERPLF